MVEETTDPGIVTSLMIYQEVRQTGKQVAALDTRMAGVETKIGGLVPKIELASNKADKATENVASIRGQWKVLFYFLSAGSLGMLLWAFKTWLAS